MNQANQPERFSPPWVLIIGLILGAVFVGGVFLSGASSVFRDRAPFGNSLPKSVDVIELTDANWQKEVVESDVPVLVDFWAPWCGPCRELSPTIEQLAERYKGKIKVCKLNVDDSDKISAKIITSIPRVMIFKGGEAPRASFVGLQSEAKLASAIDAVLAAK